MAHDWSTPPKYVFLVNEFFGESISLNSCSNEYSLIDAKREVMLPEDGLSIDWNYASIYLKPPYGRDKERETTIWHWLKKAAEANEIYDSQVLSLIPVATNTRH